MPAAFNRTDILRQILRHILTMPLEIAYRLPGEKHTVTHGSPWVEFSISPMSAELVAYGPNRLEQDFMFRITLHYPPDKGSIAVMEKSDEVMERFYDSTSILSNFLYEDTSGKYYVETKVESPPTYNLYEMDEEIVSVVDVFLRASTY